jgi:hypothetical protein
MGKLNAKIGKLNIERRKRIITNQQKKKASFAISWLFKE